jgi:hypothetical protein
MLAIMMDVEGQDLDQWNEEEENEDDEMMLHSLDRFALALGVRSLGVRFLADAISRMKSLQ